MKTKTQTPQTRPLGNNTQLTFLEHLLELRRRLFWVIGTVLVVSMAVFPMQETLLKVVTWPLGEQPLYYLTPAGGFGLILKLCMYAGILAAIPVAMYHLYKYLEPLLVTMPGRRVMRYTSLSLILAITGVFFAYFISLPAALHFLTSVGDSSIQAMLTADAYLSFVMTYLLAAALLFQLPLILMIINTVKPLKPRKLLSGMRYAIVAAFVVAAVISPTPDIANQTLLAAPMIIMYLLGIGLVAWRNYRVPQPLSPIVVAPVAPKIEVPVLITTHSMVKPVRVIQVDGFRPVVKNTTVSLPVVRSEPLPASLTRSVDGIVGVRRMPLSAA